MKHIVTIPQHYKTTVEKVNKFIPLSVWRSIPMEITKHQFTKHSLQLFVKPWMDREYIYCLSCQYNELPKDKYFELYKSGKHLKATFVRDAQQFNVVIDDGEQEQESF